VIIEGCEESGSFDLPYYIEHLRARIGTPTLVICLDSGAADYDRLWCTTSLRGMVIGNLHVDVLREGVHSGDASGIVPSSWIARLLLSRPEDEATEDRRSGLHRDSAQRRRSSHTGALGKAVTIIGAANAARHADPVEMILNRTWRPQLAITARWSAGSAGQRAAWHAGVPARWAAGVAPQAGTLFIATEDALRVEVRSSREARRLNGRLARGQAALRECRSLFGSPQATWAKAARSRSWPCSASSSPRRSF
jgi:hypothetical protein